MRFIMTLQPRMGSRSRKETAVLEGKRKGVGPEPTRRKRSPTVSGLPPPLNFDCARGRKRSVGRGSFAKDPSEIRGSPLSAPGRSWPSTRPKSPPWLTRTTWRRALVPCIDSRKTCSRSFNYFPPYGSTSANHFTLCSCPVQMSHSNVSFQAGFSNRGIIFVERRQRWAILLLTSLLFKGMFKGDALYAPMIERCSGIPPSVSRRKHRIHLPLILMGYSVRKDVSAVDLSWVSLYFSSEQ